MVSMTANITVTAAISLLAPNEKSLKNDVESNYGMQYNVM